MNEPVSRDDFHTLIRELNVRLEKLSANQFVTHTMATGALMAHPNFDAAIAAMQLTGEATLATMLNDGKLIDSQIDNFQGALAVALASLRKLRPDSASSQQQSPG